jgi:hypothetical protein
MLVEKKNNNAHRTGLLLVVVNMAYCARDMFDAAKDDDILSVVSYSYLYSHF